MARKRIIDPEFWSDEEIGQWSFEARLFYIGLWNFADDEGRFKAHSDLLKSQIYPYDKKIDIEKLKKELNHKVQWYEVSGLQYGFICNFLKYQRIDRPTLSKLPIPPLIDEQSSSNRGQLAPNIIEVKLSEVKLSKDKLIKPAVENPTANVNNSKTIVKNFLEAYDDTSQIGKKSEQDLSLEIQTAWLGKFPDKPLNYGVIKNMLRGTKPYQRVGDLDKQARFILEQIRAMPADLEKPIARLGDIITKPGKYIKEKGVGR